MDQDPWSDPDAQEWIAHVRKTLVPMLEGSSISCMLGPDIGNADVKFAVELGMSILLDKPILVIALPGRKVPDKLRMIADDIVYCDPGTSEGQKDLYEAIEGMHQRLGLT